ncbi:LysR family transcriptional regulator (plasmid) [Paracoccus yeei]|uniref:LysR family transcriptional regulator n=1 Tax=Paracoccus yeei TaxID=147645 RepID=A0A1V0GYP1_9RHOB|nr:LysR family transcriptional regulator [Paracoccus yeei]ARC38938.1 LysR family transcriptional regulator [Paracoccus yeei]
MDTRFLESFVVLTESASVAEAARRVRLTPAALTLRINALEDELGYTLISRVGRTVRPTAAGLRVAERARALLKDIRDLHMLGEAGELKGELRLGVATGAVAGVFCDLLPSLARRHPGLELSVTKATSSALYALLQEERIDAALMFRPPFEVPKSLDWRVLRYEPYVVIAAPNLQPQDAHGLLRSQPFIRYDRKLWSGRIADDYLRAMEIQPRERLELDGLEAIAVLVNRGLGVSLVPDWSTPWPEGLQLVKHPLIGTPPVRALGMMWPRNTPRLPFVNALLDAS